MKKQSSKKAYIIWWIVAAMFLLTSFSFLPGQVAEFFTGLLITAFCGFMGWQSFQRPRKAAAEAEKKRAEEAERRRQFEEKHGNLFLTVAGVTFDNDDGTSRQRTLKAIFQDPDEDGEVTLEPYEYRGKPAIYVLYEGRCVGNIRQSEVKDVMAVIDKIEKMDLLADSFKDDDDKTVYRADLAIQYSKQ